jgi:glutathione S-transferase
MSCTICEYLERAYEATLSEYIQARRSACYQLCMELAAQKNVDMERARYELQEHQSACLSATKMLPARLPQRALPASRKQLVA